MIVVDLLYNLSLLAALSVLSGFIDARWDRTTWVGKFLQGCLFGTASVIGMLRPLVLGEGLIFDGRSVLLSLCGLFFGPLPTGIAAGMAIVCRVLQGGPGVRMGVPVILASALIGLVMRARRKGPGEITAVQLYLLGIVVHVVMDAMMLLLPREMALNSLTKVAVPVLALYPVATVVIGTVLRDQEARGRFAGALRESESRFAALVASVPGAVYQCDPTPPFVGRYLSDGVEAIAGRTSAELGSDPRGWGGLVEPEELDQTVERMCAAIEAHEPYAVAYRIRHADGGLRWVHEAGQATYGADGSPLHLDGVIVDVTEQRRAERALSCANRVAQAFLTHSNDAVYPEVLQVLLEAMDSTHGFIGYIDESGALVLPALSAVAAAKEHLSGDPPVVPKEKWSGLWGQALREGKALLSSERPTFPGGHITRSGAMAAPLKSHGEAVGVICLADKPGGYRTDDLRLLETTATYIGPLLGAVVEERRRERERRELELRVERSQRMESLGVLAGGIAHDFNNLLTGVLGNASLALDMLPEDSPAREAVRNVETAAVRASELSRQMLAYSGKGRFVVTLLSLSELVDEMTQLLKSCISRNASLAIDLSASDTTVEGDPTQLRQVVMNLITNASDALGEETGSVSIRTGVIEADAALFEETYLAPEAPPGEYVFLEVADTGCGMDEEARQRVFEPFYTTKATGRGLGMAAVVGIVRSHDGALRIQSAPGRGTTITVLLPKASVVEEEPGLGRAEPMPEPLAQRERRGGAVLVADDDPAVRRIATLSLTNAGYEVLEAEDGVGAVEAFCGRPETIVCVVLDVTMPRMGGEECLAEIRAIRSDVPVVLSSGYTEHDISGRLTTRERVGFVGKPYRPSELVAEVGRLLASDRPAEESAADAQ